MDKIILLFIQGVISFFSPCILALIPLYMGYLSTDAKETDEFGNITYKKKTIVLLTVFFVMGISTVFFLAGLSASVIRDLLFDYKIYFLIIGGVILLILGLFNLGLINIPLLQKDIRLNSKSFSKMTVIKAFLLGFLFSFAWTPCIGPLLSSAIIMAASADNALIGNAYIFAYSLGFVLSFIIFGLFSEKLFSLFKNKQKILNRIVKIGGLLILLMSGWLFYQAFNDINHLIDNSHNQEEVVDTDLNDSDLNDIDKFSFSLEDQNGEIYNLKDYEGKPIIVSFFATWCTYCKEQIQVLKELSLDDSIEVFVIANPSFNNEKSKEELVQYIIDNDLEDVTFLFDDTSTLSKYRVSSYPTSFIFKSDGNLLGYIPGATELDVFNDYIKQAK
ncbi:MAG: cytochrome c biogenesis protein CcdA [Anaerorhabdus sp.]